MIESSAIADLEVAPSQPAEVEVEDLTTPFATTQHEKAHVSLPSYSQDPSVGFVDPAILSYRKPATVRNAGAPAPRPHVLPDSPVMIANGAVSSPSTRLPPRTDVGHSSGSSIATAVPNQVPDHQRSSSATATLSEPFDALSLKKDTKEDEAAEPKVTDNRRQNPNATSQTGPGIIDLKDVHHGPLKASKKSGGKGKGWRQTPLIEEVPRQNGRKTQRGRRAIGEANGWATEDATDIQDMGDFDFESNLSKFDKRRVFDDIRKEDTTAHDERLVSFNRKPRPGTNGGRNLHFTENVLDVPEVNDRDRWKSEAGETEDDLNGEHYSSGKGSRRAGSRRPLQSRKGSAIPGHIDRTESPRPVVARMQTASPLNGSVSGIRASFRLPNNKPCHCVSPLQMLEIEQLCTSELGLTEDILSENAGRSIAMAVLKIPEVKKSVVFLVGNHKSGARAVAAARHLRNRRLRVTIVVLGGEREELLFEIMRKQLAIYKKGQGYVDRWDEYQTVSTAGGPPPDVIVDALLGVHTVFDELRTDDQATVLEMIRWANRTAPVLSVDVPSGLSATSGLLTEVDGQTLVMSSKHVIALGAPKSGLLHGMAREAAEPTSTWQVWVADIGISTGAWHKHGSRRKHGVDFGTDWIVPLKFVLGGPS